MDATTIQSLENCDLDRSAEWLRNFGFVDFARFPGLLQLGFKINQPIF